MTDLIEVIKDKLDIPCVEPGDAIMDGCFLATPYWTSGVRGNGKLLELNDYVLVDLFYRDRTECLNNTKGLISELNINPRYSFENPSYSYEEDAGLYHASINIIIIGGID